MNKRKMKLSTEKRIDLIERILKKEINVSEAAKVAGVGLTTIYRWIGLYENEGPAGLAVTHKNRHYSKELKLTAVLAYLEGSNSLQEVAKNYGVRNKKQLEDWIKVYNTHGNFKSESGGSKVRQTKEFSPEERMEIVLYCIAQDYDYSATAVKYQAKYSSVYNWVKRYEKLGQVGLEDRRGRRKAAQTGRTSEEESQIKIAQLEEQLKYKQMEVDLLKKVKAFERRDLPNK
ncbi:helix-turn-helix domain-containing protein [Tetragenococcus halophilus]|uniref:helix-turn-helix domain-containing protein n=1 Tax=Tetragenococcus halophilus TaxID=51669 RepID=UPI0030C8EFD8